MIFEEGGLLSQQIEGYEERQGQINMAADLKDFLEEDTKVFIAEAPVGVGKSMAYLLPFLLNVEDRVVISTSSITLQNQLNNKDLIDASNIIKKETGEDIRFACLKGIGNYVCVKELEEGNFTIETSEIEDDIEKMRTMHQGFDKFNGEKPDEIHWKAWNLITTTSNECMKYNCKYSNECYYLRRKKEARNSDVLIVNHALLAADFFIKQEIGGAAKVLPDYENLVIDEVHELENSFAGFFTRVISRRSIKRIITKITNLPAKIEDEDGMHDGDKKRFIDKSLEFEEKLKTLNFEPLLERIAEEREKGYGNLITHGFAGVVNKLIPTIEEIAEYCLTAEYFNENNLQKEKPLSVHGFGITMDNFKKSLKRLKNPPKEYAIWTEGSEKYPKLKICKINIGDFLRSHWSGLENVVMTSATISVNGEFSFIKDRLGIDVPTKTGIYDTPFDYAEQAKLIIPKDFNPKKPDFDDKVFAGIKKVVENGYSKSLILFTSYRQMNNLLPKIKKEFNQEYLVLEQSKNLSKDFILNKFRKEKKAILVAQAASFGTGVDVKGDKNIILVKLNFDNPQDPLFKARGNAIKERGGNEFMDLSIPNVCIKTKQQIGRSIRSSKDRAYIAILDGRIVKSHWGRKILRTLPKMTLYKTI